MSTPEAVLHEPFVAPAPIPGDRGPQPARGGNAKRPFRQALEELAACVGAGHVKSDPREVAEKSRCTVPQTQMPLAFVYPNSSAEVQAVVRVAARHGLPLWPVSRGKNWGYGSASPARSGGIVVVLERMNRILEVNEELAYAVLEPGVTYSQFARHLAERGGKLWADTTDGPPDGSVVGNALERGVGYTPYGDHFGALCGLEAVLPNGEIVRTGGGPENCRTFHTYRWGAGPFLDGLFSQSSFGIVTKAGIGCMPRPEACACFILQARSGEEFSAALDRLRKLALHRTIGNIHCWNDFLLGASLVKYPMEMRNGRTHLSEQSREELRRNLGLAPWTAVGGLYGTAAQVRAHKKFVKRELAGLGKLGFFGDRAVSILGRAAPWVERFPVLGRVLNLCGVPSKMVSAISEVYPIFKGVPGDFVVRSAAYFKNGGAERAARSGENVDAPRDGCGLIWFVPAIPNTGADFNAIRRCCEPLFEKHGFEFMLALIMANPRTLLAAMPLIYDRKNADETARAQALYEDLASSTLELGYQQYRTGAAWSPRMLDAAPAFQRLAQTLKDAVDPGGILAPGKYGLR